ncbi:MAG: DUF4286 family protein [Phycisphaerae bacterium]|nr:DUF4286 family protein [Phycisphaerae bacterium]
MIYYEVHAHLRDVDVAERWLNWMSTTHIADVTAAGALSGRIVRLDSESEEDEGLAYLAQYEFADRPAFEAYLYEHAPRLRAEGMLNFPPELVRYTRRSGEIIEPD